MHLLIVNLTIPFVGFDRLWDYLFALPTTQTPADGRAIPGRDGVEIRDVERGELRSDGGLKRTRVDP